MKRFILCLVGALALFVSCYNPASMGTESVTVQERWNYVGNFYTVYNSDVSSLTDMNNFPSSDFRFEKIGTKTAPSNIINVFDFLDSNGDMHRCRIVDVYKVYIKESSTINGVTIRSNLTLGRVAYGFGYENNQFIIYPNQQSDFEQTLANYQ